MNTKYFMFCLVNFMSFLNIHPFLSFRPANTFQKKLGTEQFRASNEVNWLIMMCFETVDVQQVIVIMIWYKSSIQKGLVL